VIFGAKEERDEIGMRKGGFRLFSFSFAKTAVYEAPAGDGMVSR
jgi:hypothetical protein